MVGGPVIRWATHLFCHPSQDGRSNKLSKGTTPGQGNAGCANPASIKMNGVLARCFADLHHVQCRRDELFAPQFVKYLLSYCFYWEGREWHKLVYYSVAAQDYRVIPEVQWHPSNTPPSASTRWDPVGPNIGNVCRVPGCSKGDAPG